MKALRKVHTTDPGTINIKTLVNVASAFLAVLTFAGCAVEHSPEKDFVAEYQESLAGQGPQERISDRGLESLEPASGPEIPQLEIFGDPNSVQPIINLSLEEALVRTLANSADIRIVSFDPSIAAQEITRAYGDFDPAVFGRLDYENNDSPVNSLSDVGRQESRVWESGIKQKNAIGSEWSASYALVRNWDDLFGRALSTRYEPMMLFQIRQPLLRDAWQLVNMAGINIARLNHKASLAAFRQKTEDVATQVTTAYWVLYQTQQDVEIQQRLLDKTIDTFLKMRDRKGIDATTLHLKQVESALKSRQATLVVARKRFTDIQDALVRFLADKQLSLLGDYKIWPTTPPVLEAQKPDSSQVLRQALETNPLIEQARLGIEVAEINVEVAKVQKMPRLDLIATARLQGLGRGYGQANEVVRDRDYDSYSIGITFEYPLGNRQRLAELRKRRLERSKASSILQNISDQVAVQAKERIREIDTTQSRMQIQAEAVEAAKIHLKALEDTELVRQNLTPEFLLVKLQAQESLASAQRARIKALVDFNNAIVQLAKTQGTVLQLHRIKSSMPAVSRGK